MKFEWDTNKNQSNVKKHGVNFDEAKSVFDDILALVIDDRFHSHSEVREIIVGESSKSRLLYVVFVEREDCIRIVSARKLTTAERRCYEQGRFD